ncbi:beta-N-acetylhexosaminidase family protein [Saccharopolyspora hirsuta]|uniref:beta-N-acetylhexosaminidase family protein n=1 Tax=Saccharopolyspora hirsuta TaxID=1837 RepID=UPI001FEABD3C|nr:beta-N-acetylglucosaminidase domain-containing protein [Saccharopolyspora hirsuta]
MIRSVLGLAGAALLAAGAAAPATADPDSPLPQITPQPQQVVQLGDDVPVPERVSVVADREVDRPTRDLLVAVLRGAGAEDVDVVDAGQQPDAPLVVRVGGIGTDDIARGLREAGVEVPPDLPAEGYALAAKDGAVVLGGVDPDGVYYSAQTLRQLVRAHGIAGAGIVDHPLMPLRGAIEGFYGSPWTHQERLDQLAFYGDVKMNTYIYAPKDDPYHREKWRDPYPADKLAELGELIAQGDAHHVRFTFALSPGLSICYTSEQDWQALVAKLQAMYDLGVRAFSLPLDDIDYTKWNCAEDEAKYGAPSQQSAGQAQVDLLNRVQREFIATHEGAQPLQTVPTEYSDTEDSPYKRTIREQLDPAVEVMWTGVGVVPPEITVPQAQEAAAVWGRKVFVWDNYPVNDFDATAGRLLLAPYAEREAGLHDQLSGIVLNPMNQASASKVAEFGAADFSWNDTGYDANRAWREAARYLAGGDAATAEALLAFFDLEHLSPTLEGEIWQPQAPELARRIEEFRAKWAEDQGAAIQALRPYAELIAAAPQRIRDGVVDPGFVADAAPWLEATDLWGPALLASLDGLQSRVDGDEAAAEKAFAEAADLARRAGEIRTIPGETRPEGPVRVGDGVLDTFIAEAPDLR